MRILSSLTCTILYTLLALAGTLHHSRRSDCTADAAMAPSTPHNPPGVGYGAVDGKRKSAYGDADVLDLEGSVAMDAHDAYAWEDGSRGLDGGDMEMEEDYEEEFSSRPTCRGAKQWVGASACALAGAGVFMVSMGFFTDSGPSHGRRKFDHVVISSSDSAVTGVKVLTASAAKTSVDDFCFNSSEADSSEKWWYGINATVYDDDATFDVDACGSNDKHVCATECTADTNCNGLCGTACTEEWGVPCVWETIANMPDSCMNMYEPVMPAAMRSPAAREDLAEMERAAAIGAAASAAALRAVQYTSQVAATRSKGQTGELGVDVVEPPSGGQRRRAASAQAAKLAKVAEMAEDDGSEEETPAAEDVDTLHTNDDSTDDSIDCIDGCSVHALVKYCGGVGDDMNVYCAAVLDYYSDQSYGLATMAMRAVNDDWPYWCASPTVAEAMRR